MSEFRVTFTSMSEFRVTFGQKYRHETHPMWASAHPDGWVTVVADDYGLAREWTIENFGTAWSDLYDADEHKSTDAELYPLGELARFDASIVVLP